MTSFKKIYFLSFFIIPFVVLGEINLDEENKNSLNPSPEKEISLVSSSNVNYIKTENKYLLKSLTKYFKQKPISKKEIQNFLIQNSYYQSEVIKEKEFYLITKPVQTIFVFKGNKFFSEKEIRKIIKIDKNKAGVLFYNFVETAIKNSYQNQGFLKIKVEKKVVKRNWKEWVYLYISEGSRIRITELKIKGLLSKPDSYYEDFIRNNSSDLIKRGFYSKKDLETGYENLINYLKSQGYLQSKIYSDRIFLKDNKAFITIHLEEGFLTIIRDIQIQNAKSLPVFEILSHMKSRIQSPLEIDTLQEDMNSIEQLYKSKGYLQMKIKNKKDVIKYIPGERYVSIVVQVDEGPRAFISKISIEGLRKAKESMVRSLLKFKIGDVLTPLKKEQSIKSLGATGLWTDVSFDEKFIDDQLEVYIVFKERKPRSLRGGLGINTERGWTTRAYSEVAHRNLFGHGRAFITRASGQINLNHQRPEYEVFGRYKEVFIPGYGYQGNISLTQSQNVFRYSTNKEINFVNKTQISFFINKNISDNFKMRWNVWSFENRREHCIPDDCPENPQQIASIGFNVIWDKRDNIFDPSNGFLSSLTTEFSSSFLGSSSDISFVKADLQNHLYWTFIKNYTLGLTVKGGIIQTVQNSQYLPVSRAFILGGQASVRGYDGNIEGERIPNRKSAPIETANEALHLQKGDLVENVLFSSYGLLNADIRFPIFKDFKGVLFYDLGAVYLKGQSQKIWNHGHSVGLGFRYQTFLIPIGLDIAYKLQAKEGSSHRFHFSIGW